MAKKSTPEISDRKTRVFLSYSRKDIEFAQLLKTELEARGFHPMLDKTDIAPGEAWQDRLSKLIIEADAVVFSVSPNSAASKICAWEVAEAGRLGKRIIPVVVDPVDTGILPDALTRLNFIFFTDVSFEEALAKLNLALNTDLDWVRQHTRLGEQAIEWEARKKSGARLLTGDALRQAEGWLINQPRDASPPTDLQKQFILASRRSINIFQRWSLIGAIVVAAIAVILVFWGLINQIAKDEALQAADNTIQVAIQSSRSLIEETTSGKFENLSSPTKLQILQFALSVPDDLEKTGQSNPDIAIVQSNAKSEISALLLDLKSSSDALDYAQQGVEVLQNQVDKNLASLELSKQITLLDYLSLAYNRLFAIQRQINEMDGALASAKRELEVAEDALKLAPENVHWRESVATSYIDMGQAQRSLGQKPEALANLKIAQEKLDKLVEENPDDPRLASNRSVAYEQIGSLLSSDNKDEEALVYFKTCLDIAQKLYGTDKDSPDYQSSLAIAYQNVGRTLMWLDKKDEALLNLKPFLEFTKKLSDLDPENASKLSNFAIANNALGTLYQKMGDSENALHYLQQDVALTEQLAKADENNYSLNANLARSYTNMAELGSEPRANYDKALAVLAELAKKKPLLVGENDLKTQIETELAALPQ